MYLILECGLWREWLLGYWAFRKVHSQKIRVVEMQMIYWMSGHILRDKIRWMSGHSRKKKLKIANNEEKMKVNCLR